MTGNSNDFSNKDELSKAFVYIPFSLLKHILNLINVVFTEKITKMYTSTCKLCFFKCDPDDVGFDLCDNIEELQKIIEEIFNKQVRFRLFLSFIVKKNLMIFVDSCHIRRLLDCLSSMQ